MSFESDFTPEEEFEISEIPKRRDEKGVVSVMETYLREIADTPLLTAQEEKALAYRIINGDSSAREQMIRANLRLVVNIARAHTRKGVALQDLIEEGNLGLMRAVEGFDPKRGTRFSTYASYWIKQCMQRSIMNSGKTVRIPTYMHDLLAKWRTATAQLTSSLGRAPTDMEMIKALALSKKKFTLIKHAMHIYHAVPQANDTEGCTLDETLVDSRTRSADMDMIIQDDRAKMHMLLQKIDRREASILRMRFGLNTEKPPMSLKEVGRALGITRERVRQIQNKALKNLAKQMDANPTMFEETRGAVHATMTNRRKLAS
jgi:RNA polymerase primary sigma factor